MLKFKSLAGELPFWQFVGNFLVFSDHSFGAGFKLSGIDITFLDHSEINLIVDRIEKLLVSLEPGVRLQVLYRLTPKVDEILDQHLSVSKDTRDDVKEVAKYRAQYLYGLAEQGHFFKPEIYLFIRSEKAKLKKLRFFEKVEKYQQITAEELSNRLNQFEKVVSFVQSSLSSLDLKPSTLSKQDWFKLLFNRLNPDRSETIGDTDLKNALSPFGLSLAQQLCLTDLEIHPKGLKIGESLARVISLKTLPERETFASMVGGLLKLPFPFEISQTIHIPEQKSELDKLQVQRRLAHSMAAGAKNVRDLESEAQLTDLETLIEELLSGSEKVVYSDLSLIIFGTSENDLDEKTDEVLKSFRQMSSAEGVAETLPSFEGYIKALPGICDLFRARKMKSSNAAHFMPIFSTWEGNEKPVCLIPNRDGTLVSVDPFSSELPNWNGIIFGGSGSGKSFTVANLILSFIAQNPEPKVIWIDNGASSQKLVESFEGEFIDLGLESNIRLNLFDLPANGTKPPPYKVKLILAVLETILKEDDKSSLPKREKALLEEVIYQAYETCAPRIPILSDLRSQLSEHSSVEMRNYAQTLYSWTGQTAYGRMLDGQSNVTLTKNLTTVEISGLNSHPALQNVFLLLLTDFIRSEAARDLKTPYLLIIDEAWRIFQASESGREFALECYRLLRKFMAAIFCLTQNYRDFLSDPQVAESILPNTVHFFILRQKKIDWEDFKKTMGLKDAEIAAIQSLEIKKGEYSEVFYMQDEKRSLLRIRPDRLSYLICTSDGKDRAMIEDMKQKYPSLSRLELLQKLVTEEVK
ncbi:MAG: TraC family protein [Bdellovibrionia bacterium]